MKIALLALLGLALGRWAARHWHRGRLAWVQIFKTTSFEGYSGMLVFFTFMPLGAAIGGIGVALLFGMIAIGDAEIAIEREPVRGHDGQVIGKRSKSPHLCNAKTTIVFWPIATI